MTSKINTEAQNKSHRMGSAPECLDNFLKGRVPPFGHKSVFTRATISQCGPLVHFPIFVSGNA